MSYLEKLLDGVEVEWLPLGEVSKYEQPTKYLVQSTNYSDNFETPVLTAGKTFILGYTDETDGIYKASNKPVIIFDDFTTAHKWVDFDFKAKSSAMKMISSADESRTLSKYIYYWLNTLPSELVDGDHKRQWIDNYAKKEIPIPCPENPAKSLEIQAEIVRILDAFSELTAELAAELAARKKQYNYYRDQLLRFVEGGVEWKSLGELATLITKGTTPKEFANEGINFIKLESFDNSRISRDKFMFISPEIHLKELKRSILEANDILFAIAGATIGKCAIVEESVLPANTNQALAIIRLDKHVSVKFVFYYMQTIVMKEYIAKFNKTSAQPNLNLRQISGFKIPVPSLEEQERIVAILDKFDTLTNSISEGLPREIALRQQQYAYYRDLLFSFPKPAEA